MTTKNSSRSKIFLVIYIYKKKLLFSSSKIHFNNIYYYIKNISIIKFLYEARQKKKNRYFCFSFIFNILFLYLFFYKVIFLDTFFLVLSHSEQKLNFILLYFLPSLEFFIQNFTKSRKIDKETFSSIYKKINLIFKKFQQKKTRT
jgi:hypothetical protein